MNKFSSRSESKLRGVHPDLVKVVRLALTYSEIDFGITQGERSAKQQLEKVAEVRARGEAIFPQRKVGTKEQEERFIKKLKNNPLVVYLAVLSGRWDYNLSICARNPKHFNEILKEIRAIEPDYIKEFEIFTIVSEEKYESSLGLLD